MALTLPAVNILLNEMKLSFSTVGIVKETSTTIIIGDPVTQPTVTLLDTVKTLNWGTATNGSIIETTNRANSTPLNFSLMLNSTPNTFVLVDSFNVVRCIIDITTPLPTYTAGDGAYFLRGITLTLTVV